MRRREFLGVIGGAAVVAWPLAARAQQSNRVRRVSLLLGLAESDPEAKSRLQAFRYGLRDLEWIEGTQRSDRIPVRRESSRSDREAGGGGDSVGAGYHCHT
jgi:putative ABC transport system substrate-binding protein